MKPMKWPIEEWQRLDPNKAVRDLRPTQTVTILADAVHDIAVLHDEVAMLWATIEAIRRKPKVRPQKQKPTENDNSGYCHWCGGFVASLGGQVSWRHNQWQVEHLDCVARWGGVKLKPSPEIARQAHEAYTKDVINGHGELT